MRGAMSVASRPVTTGPIVSSTIARTAGMQL